MVPIPQSLMIAFKLSSNKAGNMPGLACERHANVRDTGGKDLIVPAEPVLEQHAANQCHIKASSSGCQAPIQHA